MDIQRTLKCYLYQTIYLRKVDRIDIYCHSFPLTRGYTGDFFARNFLKSSTKYGDYTMDDFFDSSKNIQLTEIIAITNDDFKKSLLKIASVAAALVGCG